MRKVHVSYPHRLVLTAAALLALVAGLPALAGFDQEHSFQSDELTVHNMIGEISISGHGGSEFEVLVHVRGDDASEELVRVEVDEGSSPELAVVFPLDKEKSYVYPAMGSKSKSSFTLDKEGAGWLSSLLGAISSRKITVKGSGSGLEVWADVEIRVPEGGSLVMMHRVGEIVANNVDGNLHLDNASGSINVEGVTGSLLADTGSGHVTVRDAGGAVHVDTGSGHVELEQARGDSILIDTGSGHVTVRDVETSTLSVDTGSGNVKASAIRAESASIDTGSGAVELILLRMGKGDYSVDTGSGRVTLGLPADASADVRAETGSGSIKLELDDSVEIRRKEKDEIRFVVGGGDAEVEVDTGSGSIRIIRSDG